MVASLESSKSVKLVNSLILFFRHEWNDKIWKNNIHTESYAKYLGYDKGLIEAPCFVDILLSNIEVGKLMKNKISFKWEYYAPLYHGISVNVFLEEDEKIHTLYVCHKSDNTILMTLNIHNNEK